MAYGDKPFGLRDVKLTNIGGTTQVDLPAGQKLGFKFRMTTGELRGDDQIMSIQSMVDAAEWSLEAGGISLEAWALLTGYTQTEAGTTPSQTNTLNITGGACMPYFKIYGKVVGDTCADDIHVLLYKCKLTEPLEGEFSDGEFMITKCAGIAIDDVTNGLVDFVQNETAAALPSA